MVDLRSDTVTRPTEAMRRAMAEAEVGDSLYGEDPTVNRLEEVFANRVGKEAALFVPSGTMANQIALRLYGRPGTIVLTPRRAHVVVHEGGAAAVNSPTQFHLLDDDEGEVDPAGVQRVIEASAHHQPEASLLWLENTHMPAAGAPWSLAGLKAVTAEARGGALKVHLDGARLFNAEASTGTTAAEYSAQADTVMCCLSKGLCAPVGSVLAGSADDMARARVERQRLGGGMRQAGVIAAAGIVGLEQMIQRLPEDHERAKRLADVVAERWPGSGCDPAMVRTNIVTWSVPDTDELIAHLRAEGVLAGTIAPGVMRLVTHHDVDDDGVERVRKALASAP